MSPTIIQVDVSAEWTDTPPVYRVYVDTDLLTERDFIWESNVCIEECIVVELLPGSHTLRIEHVNDIGRIHTNNILIDGVPSSSDFVVAA